MQMKFFYEIILQLKKKKKKKEVKSVVQNLVTRKSLGSDGYTAELYQTFKEELIPILSNVFIN